MINTTYNDMFWLKPYALFSVLNGLKPISIDIPEFNINFY